MSIRTTTKNVVKAWARIPAIPNTLAEICVLFAGGHPGMPCQPALQTLITDLRRAFPTINLSSLRPTDLTGSGRIKTVETLIQHIAGSPSKAPAPDSDFSLTSGMTKALSGGKESSKKGGAKKASKTGAKKAGKKKAGKKREGKKSEGKKSPTPKSSGSKARRASGKSDKGGKKR